MEKRIIGWQKAALVCSLALLILLVSAGLRRVYPEDVDSASYRRMAAGRISEVVAPYTKRILNPLLIRAVASVLSRGSGRPDGRLETTATTVSVFWLLLALTCFVELLSTRLPAWKILLFGFNPVFVFAAFHTWLPDLPAMALLLATFLALDKAGLPGSATAACAEAETAHVRDTEPENTETVPHPDVRKIWYSFSFFFLFLTILSRESTLLVAVVWMFLAFTGRRRREAFAVLVSCLLGFAAVSWLSRNGQGNIHGVGGAAYMAMKAVANGLANFAGLDLWSNVYAETLPHFYPDAPMWKMSLPAFLQFGRIREIGLYSFRPHQFFSTLLALVFFFGLLVPYSLGRFREILRRRGANRFWRDLRDGNCFLPFFYVLTGSCFFLLAPFSGRSLLRLTGYAWPLFWLCSVPDADQNGRFSRALPCVAQAILPWLTLFAPPLSPC